MKKLVLVLCLSLGIVGCGGTKSSDTENSIPVSEMSADSSDIVNPLINLFNTQL